MSNKRINNDTDQWSPHESFAPPQRTDSENVEYTSTRAPNSTTHSIDSRSSTNSELSPKEYQSTSLLHSTGALFTQTSPQGSTISSIDSTTSNMPVLTHDTAVPGDTPPHLHNHPLPEDFRGVKRQGSDVDDTPRLVASRPAAAAALRSRHRARDNMSDAEDASTSARSFGVGWQLTDSPTSVSHHGGALEEQNSSNASGRNDSDDEGKSKGDKRQRSGAPAS